MISRKIVNSLALPSLLTVMGLFFPADVISTANKGLTNMIRTDAVNITPSADIQYYNNSTQVISADDEALYVYNALEIIVIPDPPPPPPPPRASTVSRSRSAAPVASRSIDYSRTGTQLGSDVVAFAKQFVGTAYVAGGKDPGGFDCSGFTSYIYSNFGVSLPGSSKAQRNYGTVVDAPEPGDLIWSPGHVGIYVGDGQQIDAPRPGKTIQVRGIWQQNPVFLRLI